MRFAVVANVSGGVAIWALVAACGNDFRDACPSAYASGRYAEAAEACEGAFAEGDPRAGVLAVRSRIQLGDVPGTLRSWRRLSGTNEEREILLEVGDLLRRSGELDEADTAYARLTRLAEASGQSALAAEGLCKQAGISWATSDYRRALDHAAACYEHARRGESREWSGNALRVLFAVFYALGDTRGGLQALREASDLAAPGDPTSRASLLLNEAAVRIDEGRMHVARVALQRALDLSGEIQRRQFFRSLHLNFVEVYWALDELSRAEQHLRKAWRYDEPDGSGQTALLYWEAELARARDDLERAGHLLRIARSQGPILEWRWRLEFLDGAVREASGDALDAERQYLDSIATVEAMRASMKLDDLKSRLLEQKRRPYEALFRIRAARGDVRGAVEVMEQAKARTFLDAFVASTSSTTAPTPESALESASAASLRLAALGEWMPSLLESPVVSQRAPDVVLDALRDVRVLAYFRAEDTFWIVKLSGGSAELGRVPMSAGRLEELVARLEANLDDGEAAELLGEQLLRGLGEWRRGDTIHIVADGALGRIPFGLLHHEGGYLVEEFDLTHVPSLGALAAMRDRPTGGGGTAHVLGDPRGDLPASREEAGKVAEALGVMPRVGSKATAAGLRQAATAKVLHIATHAGLSHRGPWLALADGDIGPEEILGYRGDSELVFLASCASAARDRKDLWGSLAGAFLAAGARRVVATHYSVEDEPTREFVQRFYEEGGAENSSRAVARVQRRFVAEGSRPSEWAAFVHLGMAGGSSSQLEEGGVER